MRITVYVPKRGNKWRAKIGNGGVLQKQKFTTVYNFVEGQTVHFFKATSKEKINLVINYDEFLKDSNNEFLSRTKEKVMKDLIYGCADYMGNNLAEKYYLKYMNMHYITPSNERNGQSCKHFHK